MWTPPNQILRQRWRANVEKHTPMWSSPKQILRQRWRANVEKHIKKALQITKSPQELEKFTNNRINSWIYNYTNFRCTCYNCICSKISGISSMLIYRQADFQQLPSIKNHMLSICNSTKIGGLPIHLIKQIIDYIYSYGKPLTQSDKLCDSVVTVKDEATLCNTQEIYLQGNFPIVEKCPPLDLSLYTKKQLDIFNFIKNEIVRNVIDSVSKISYKKQKEYFKEKKQKNRAKKRAYKERKKKREQNSEPDLIHIPSCITT